MLKTSNSCLREKDGCSLNLEADTKEEADEKANKMIRKLKQSDNPPQIKFYDDADEEKMVWDIRESGLGCDCSCSRLKRNAGPAGKIPLYTPDNVGKYLRDLKKLFKKYDYDASVYGHLGQGCIHCRIPFDLRTAEGIENYQIVSR